MGEWDPYRLVPALIGGAGTAAITFMLGAPLLAVLPALVCGGAAAWLLQSDHTGPSLAAAASDQPDPFEVTRPMLAKLMDTFDDPLLLTEQQQVTMANEAARGLLGAHIVGENVRLAIRHPAAAERLTGANGGPIELVGIGEADRHWELNVHDLGQNRRLVRLSDRTSRYVAEKMRVDFVANASHELRTPLATLIGFIETLEDSKAGDDRHTRERFLSIMSDEALRMRQLIDDLISLSRIEADKFSPPDSAVPVAPFVEEVAEAIRRGIENGKERIQVDPIDALLEVKGDPPQLSQLLHNLIGNALKYGRAGTPIVVRAEAAESGMVKLSVIDQGEGIPPQHVPRLTERFYRVDSSRSRAMGGTGLGLAIVKHIVERHRGELDIRSELGVGTTVSVLLPAAS